MPILEHAGDRDLGLERGPVPPDEEERYPVDQIGVAPDRGVSLARDGHGVRVGQEAEVLTDDPLDRPAEQRLGRIGHEGEHAIGIRAPHDVGRRLDEAANRPPPG